MAEIIRSLIVKIAERCNLNCTYCYMYNHADQSYRDKPVFMTHDVFRSMIGRAAGRCQ